MVDTAISYVFQTADGGWRIAGSRISLDSLVHSYWEGLRVNLRAQDLTRLLKVVPQVVRFPIKQMWLDYDAEADVFYISFRRPQHATDSEMREDGIIVHRRGKEIVGLTILEASNR